MKIIVGTIFVAIVSVTLSSVANAHVPRVVFHSPTPITITNAEQSQAYYGELLGEPQQFLIESSNQFMLFVELLAPSIQGAQTDFVATVERKDTEPQALITRLEKTDDRWNVWHEPYFGDDYLRGPSFESVVEQGRYIITVSSPDNFGKYVLSVGRTESFGFQDIVTTIKNMPVVKAYMEKSPVEVFLNPVVGALALVFVVGSVLVWGAVRVVRRLRRGKAISLPRIVATGEDSSQ